MISAARLIGCGGGILFGISSRLRCASRFNSQGCAMVGCTGASGRAGMFVRGATGGGGFDVGGWPSASNNLRIRFSSESGGARGIGVEVLGLSVDVRFG